MKRNRTDRVRLRVFIGLLSGFVFLIAGALNLRADEPAPPDTRVLPFANASAFVTTLVVVNPTSETIPGLVLEDRIWPPLVDVMEPYSISRYRGWPRDGVNVQPLTLDARLIAYVLIETPDGIPYRYDALEPLVAADFYVPSSDTRDLEPSIFVAVPSNGYVTDVTGDEVSYEIAADTATLLPVTSERVSLRLTNRASPPLPAPPHFYAFLLLEHQGTGAVTPIPGVPLPGEIGGGH